VVLYVFWHLAAGKYLFVKFTPHPLLDHQHQYGLIFSLLYIDDIYAVCRLYYNLLSSNIKLFALLLLLLGYAAAKLKRDGYRKILLLTLFIMIPSGLLTYANVAGHRVILSTPDLWYSWYLAPAFVLFYIACVYIFFNASLIYRRRVFFGSFCFLLFLSVLVHNFNYQKYYTIHTGEIGHMTVAEGAGKYARIEKFENVLIENNIHADKTNLVFRGE
jgi:hypothetical protein